jgi:arylformamidase
MNDEQVFARLRELGAEFNPQQIEGTRALYAPLVARPAATSVAGRDLQYGPDPKQRLDLFITPHSRATLVFVHGGGFVQGDKGDAEAPFYNNVAAWALAQGYSAVNLTYRLAPAHAWPTGSQELALALDWLADELPGHDVDPRRTVLIGQSAGGAHVAAYLAGHGLEAQRTPGVAGADAGHGLEAQRTPAVAGAVLVSGIYDIASTEPPGANYAAYFGADPAVQVQRSTLAGLARTPVPCLFTVSEFDPPLFQKQAALAVAASVGARGRWPAFHWLRGHNHLSSVLQLGSAADNFGPALRRFIDELPA